jgi:hypothetical protein
MFRHWMVAAATALVLGGCDKSPMAPAPTHATPLTNGAAIDLIGVVSATIPTPLQPVMLTLDDGSSIALTGQVVPAMLSVIGAQVKVNGVAQGGGMFDTYSFVVLAVAGLPAADGVLQKTDDGYALQLADGTARPLVNPPAALIAHLGQRVWVSGPQDAPPAAFGVIQ